MPDVNQASETQEYNNFDFDAMYARSAIVRQRWPWTCLLDVKENIHFYRNEIDDFFQLAPPDDFFETESNPAVR